MTTVQTTFHERNFDARVEALANQLGLTRETLLERAFTSGLLAEEARARAMHSAGADGSRRRGLE